MFLKIILWKWGIKKPQNQNFHLRHPMKHNWKIIRNPSSPPKNLGKYPRMIQHFSKPSFWVSLLLWGVKIEVPSLHQPQPPRTTSPPTLSRQPGAHSLDFGCAPSVWRGSGCRGLFPNPREATVEIQGRLGRGEYGEVFGHYPWIDILYGLYGTHFLFQGSGKVGISFGAFGNFWWKFEGKTCILKALDGFGPPNLSKMSTKLNLHMRGCVIMCAALLGFPHNPSNTP